MLQYALLHLAGYDSVKIEDIQQFRQWGSRTPGHPENFETPGVEVTTGLFPWHKFLLEGHSPLGHGIANAVGLALAERHLAARFNTPDDEIVDHYTWKASQMKLALLLGTGVWEKLISFYDDNHISIDGDTEIAFTEDVSALIGAAMFLKVLLLKLSGMPSLQYTRRCIRSNRMNEYKESVFPAAVTARVSIEAGVTLGWGKYVGSKGKAIGIDRFGASAPAGRIYKEFGITAECIIAAAKSL
ncbi:hypothetical protein BHE74_00034583 [Ensete ventricosum]|nr:hypothetical protein BHE74_00034583 [Ensete ventricosum]